jgi:phage anti-repressor protein
VNARDLHAFLQVGKDFSTWITERIAKFDFVENADFASFLGSPIPGSQVSHGGYRGDRIEYALTLDMAEELAMVERNAKGKEARQYFIKCERDLKAKIAERVPRGKWQTRAGLRNAVGGQTASAKTRSVPSCSLRALPGDFLFWRSRIEARRDRPFRPLRMENSDRWLRAGRTRSAPIHRAPKDGLKATSSRSSAT